MVKIFCMKLDGLKKPFICTFPFEKQKAFFEGVPHTVIWNNLKVAVKKILKGKEALNLFDCLPFHWKKPVAFSRARAILRSCVSVRVL